LLLNGNTIASFTCSYPTVCDQPDITTFTPPKLAKDGAVLSYDFTCAGDPADPTGTCANPGFNATATFYYELATAQ